MQLNKFVSMLLNVQKEELKGTKYTKLGYCFGY